MKYFRFAIIMIFMTSLNTVSSLAAPILISVWSQAGQTFGADKIFTICIVLILTFILNIVLIYLRESFAVNFNVQQGKKMFSIFWNMNYDDISSSGPTNIVEKIIMAVNNNYRYYTNDAINIWSNLFILLILLLMTFNKNYLIGIILLLLVPINYFGYKWLNSELLERSKNMQEKTSQGMQSLISISGQIDYIKQSSNYDVILQKIEKPLIKMYKSMSNVNKFSQMVNQLFVNINNGSRILIMIMVVYDYAANSTNMSNLIFFTVILPIYFSAITNIVSANISKRDLTVSKEFVRWMKKCREEDGTIQLEEINTIEWSIKELKIGNKILAQNIEAIFKKGDIVWIKGKSGCGKSTLLKLLPKFRLTDTIRINDIDIRKYSNESVRNHINYLSQNVPIIQGTLLENLFLNKEYSKSLENKMLADPLLKSILSNKQISTEIYENGSNLSGGEKQKIAFIRAIYDEAEVLILDEIASNIDTQSAQDIYNRIKELRNEKIIFIISHNQLPDTFENQTIDLYNFQ